MLHGISDILANPEVRKQSVILKQITNGPSLWRYRRPVLTIENDSTRTQAFETGDAAEHRRFSGAGRSKQNRNRRCVSNADGRFETPSIQDASIYLRSTALKEAAIGCTANGRL